MNVYQHLHSPYAGLEPDDEADRLEYAGRTGDLTGLTLEERRWLAELSAAFLPGLERAERRRLAEDDFTEDERIAQAVSRA